MQGVQEDGLAVFRGIPYAAPPVGGLRFRAPQPHPGWEGARDASEFGPIAPQNVEIDLDALLPSGGDPLPQSEDCLSLNLWTPALDAAARPVLVWMHGGAFTIGSGSEPLYDGANLAARGDAVVITVNYRLGALGFLDEPALGETNFGMRDLIAALRWVRDNIANFGGDPENVTIFGESAGGAAVAVLLASPEAAGLFHRAIGQSPAGDHPLLLKRSEPATAAFYAALGLDHPTPEVLRALPIGDILAAQQAVEATLMESGDNLAALVLPFRPMIDGALLSEPPLTAVAAGRAANLPLLLGTNDEEMKLFHAMLELGDLDEAEVVRRLDSAHPDGRAVYNAYREARLARGEPAAPRDILDAAAGDHMEVMPAVRFADAYADRGAPTFVYVLDWKSPALNGALGSCHALEIPFVFGAHTRAPEFAGAGPAADALAETVMDAWLAFARHGNPSTDALHWPPYDSANRAQMLLGDRVRIEQNWRSTERAAWDGVF